MKRILKEIRSIAIVCNQWGDTGKGKFVDLLSKWAHVIARGTGGANAGHTISLNGETYVFHLLPSGILHDKDGKVNVMGTGMVIDPDEVCKELAILRKKGLSYNNLKISMKAKLVLPHHIFLDKMKSGGSGGIGTTGRGIGPAYEDHYGRTGLIMNDLLNPKVFAAKLERSLEKKMRLFESYGRELNEDRIGPVPYPTRDEILDVKTITKKYMAYGRKLRSMICDTDAFMREARGGGKKILLEGAQGLLLSIDYGTYPYVTSSDCSAEGLARGVGLSAKDIDLTFGIVKAFYMTRVGNGPFPTEFGGEKSEEWCSQEVMTRLQEKLHFGEDRISVNSPGNFLRGVAIRMAGAEYGATTGRPRRTGWLDLPLLRYAAGINGRNIILTKLDVLNQCREIKLCVGYIYKGPVYNCGGRILKKGSRIEVAIPEILKDCQPVYKSFPGWMEEIREVKKYVHLPSRLKDILNYISTHAGVNIRIISVGPDRDQTIWI